MLHKRSIIYELKCEFFEPMPHDDPLAIGKPIRITDSEGHMWCPVIVEDITIDASILIHLAHMALKSIDK